MTNEIQHPAAERLEAFAEGTLAAGDRAVIEAHLPGCHHCQTAVDEWRALFAALAGLPQFDPRPGFADRVMAGVQVVPARPRAAAAAAAWSWQSAQAAVAAWAANAGRTAGRLLPRTTFGWAVATAFLALPFVLGAAAMSWLATRSYLTVQSLVAFATEQAVYGLRALGESAVTALLRTDVATWIIAQAGHFLQTAGLTGVGVLLAAAGAATITSAWVLYRYLFRSPARDASYVSYSF
jgi:anti-sigma factor RsiW